MDDRRTAGLVSFLGYVAWLRLWHLQLMRSRDRIHCNCLLFCKAYELILICDLIPQLARTLELIRQAFPLKSAWGENSNIFYFLILTIFGCDQYHPKGLYWRYSKAW